MKRIVTIYAAGAVLITAITLAFAQPMVAHADDIEQVRLRALHSHDARGG